MKQNIYKVVFYFSDFSEVSIVLILILYMCLNNYGTKYQ